MTVWDRMYHGILPVAALTLTGVSNVALHTREKMAQVMESDYVLFARARGENLWSIIRRHGFRNILMPAITIQFSSVSEILGGTILVEQVFSYPVWARPPCSGAGRRCAASDGDCGGERRDRLRRESSGECPLRPGGSADPKGGPVR